ncbi:hypothetical protein PsYK624_168770 [Phanerochaete sordida]|uniref:Uncharacterized protein n=1 Tax=Phanerochaete sordida TaxID=48140 RepID=A0A9P3GSX0_9APHY|nr:hypothetical protein PsYK624_168770 [Phanerochaete sordida]
MDASSAALLPTLVWLRVVLPQARSGTRMAHNKPPPPPTAPPSPSFRAAPAPRSSTGLRGSRRCCAAQRRRRATSACRWTPRGGFCSSKAKWSWTISSPARGRWKLRVDGALDEQVLEQQAVRFARGGPHAKYS